MHLNFGPQVQAPSTPMNKYSSFFWKELTRLDLQTRPAWRLKLLAPHSHLHFAFLVFSPWLTLPSSPSPLRPHFPDHAHGRPPAGLQQQRSPGIRGLPHCTLGCQGCALAVSAEHRGKTAAPASTCPPTAHGAWWVRTPHSRLTAWSSFGIRVMVAS